jgi:hypothetical protein
MKKSVRPSGYVIFEGNSQIDGSPIEAIMTGISGGSANTKTGSMLQTWILRSDISPMDAAKTGLDSAICGNCPHRWHLAKENGQARCYVNIGQAPQSVWKAYKAGKYPALDLVDLGIVVLNKNVRFGSYGDPFAVPCIVWDAIRFNCAGYTGYTHQWHRKEAAEYRPFLMASVDNTFENLAAVDMGWRTFRVTIGNEDTTGSILCPASKQAGAKTTCGSCLLCGGADKKAKNIFIPDHGSGWQKRAAAAAAAAEK